MRIYILAALLLAGTATVQAQTTFGLSLGISAANNSISDFESTDNVNKLSRLGLTGGVFADLYLTPSISFHPELNYAQKGSKFEYSVPQGVRLAGGGLEGSVTTKLDYIELPLLVAYHIPAGTGLDIAVEVGPYVGYKLSEGQSCSAGLTCDDSGDGEDAFKNLDIGAAGGLVASAGPFGFGARYSNSFTNILDDPDTTVRNQAITAFARFRFGQ